MTDSAVCGDHKQTTRTIYQNLHRIVGQVLFGYFYRMLVKLAVPEEYYVSYPALLLLFVPLGTAFGTYMISNIGRMRSSLYCCDFAVSALLCM